jgi:chitodextrinase
VGVAGYRIVRNRTQVATTTATTYTDNGLAPATSYTYQVVAYDASGNESAPAQASATTWTPDTQAPTAPTNLRATVAKSGVVTLTWNASTDNVGVVGYRVLANGSQLADVTNTTTTHKPRKGSTNTYTVTAYDQAGNVSGPSNGVTVKV